MSTMGFVSEYKDMHAHDNTKLQVIHTNDKKQMATSLEQYECDLGLECHKIVGIDLEYTNEPDETQKPALVQLSDGKTQPVLPFQLSAAERCTVFDNFRVDSCTDKTKLERVNLEVTNFIDIQKEWRVNESTKNLDSLEEVACILIDDYYNNTKKKIVNEEHKRWGSLPLSKRHTEYAEKDTYTAYEI
ncbi:hypothetical protein D1007_00193 [Hordeum vulgare]|nr:hypothetical protein D1007_00193 [Hordeum vulgare]